MLYNADTMFFAATITLGLTSLESIEYKIVEVKRTAVFAGKLGDLVHEDIVVERDGNRFTVSVDGDYHTQCARTWQRLHEGENVRLSGTLGSGMNRVDRMSISKVRH